MDRWNAVAQSKVFVWMTNSDYTFIILRRE